MPRGFSTCQCCKQQVPIPKALYDDDKGAYCQPCWAAWVVEDPGHY